MTHDEIRDLLERSMPHEPKSRLYAAGIRKKRDDLHQAATEMHERLEKVRAALGRRDWHLLTERGFKLLVAEIEEAVGV